MLNQFLFVSVMSCTSLISEAPLSHDERDCNALYWQSLFKFSDKRISLPSWACASLQQSSCFCIFSYLLCFLVPVICASFLVFCFKSFSLLCVSVYVEDDFFFFSLFVVVFFSPAFNVVLSVCRIWLSIFCLRAFLLMLFFHSLAI